MTLRNVRTISGAALIAALFVTLGIAAKADSGLKAGKADLKSAGVMAFGPGGVLFVGDSAGAAIFALDTDDSSPPSSGGKVEITAINEKVAAMLGVAADQILINDLAVHPVSKKTYLSVSRGRGPDAIPVILRVDGAGRISEFELDNVKHSKVLLPNAPDAAATDRRGRSLRLQAITDLAYVDGKVFVAGLSNEEFASTLRSIPYPFSSADKGSGVEIFHGAHGRFETHAPIRTFVPYEIQKEAYLLAAYTCTPLVKFPVSALKPGAKVVGTTIAELGNRNRPLDMIIYTKDGTDFILMNNSSRGVMKMSTEKIHTFGGITEKTDVSGLPYETIAELKGVQQLDKIDDEHAVILVQAENGSLDLKTIVLP